MIEQIKNLNDTIPLMVSGDYKERFKAECYQTAIRTDALTIMIDKHERGELFYIELLKRQREAMLAYMNILLERAKIEGIEKEYESQRAEA